MKTYDERDPLAQLKQETTPVPGRPGVRVDRQGREWYSAAWIDRPLRSAS